MTPKLNKGFEEAMEQLLLLIELDRLLQASPFLQ
jgi:hypothetical protein